MIKKISAILLVLCMTVCLFAGCNNTTTTTTTSDYLIEGSGVQTGTQEGNTSGGTGSNGDNGNNNNGNSSGGQQNTGKNPLDGVDLGGATLTIYSVTEKIFDSSAKATK